MLIFTGAWCFSCLVHLNEERVGNSSRRSHVPLAFGEDFVKGFAGPMKRVCVKVPFPHKRIQAFSQMFLVREVDDAESLALQNAKPLFHLVHPRAMHGRVMELEAGMLCQPGSD